MKYFKIDEDQFDCIYAIATNTPENIDENGFSYPNSVEISHHEFLRQPYIFLHDTNGISVSSSLMSLVKDFNVKYVSINVAESDQQIYKLLPGAGSELFYIEADNKLTKGDHSRISPKENIFWGQNVGVNYFYPANNKFWEEPFFSYEFFSSLNSQCGNIFAIKEFFAVSETSNTDDFLNILNGSSFKISNYIINKFSNVFSDQEKFRKAIKLNKLLSAKEKSALMKMV